MKPWFHDHNEERLGELPVENLGSDNQVIVRIVFTKGSGKVAENQPMQRNVRYQFSKLREKH